MTRDELEGLSIGDVIRNSSGDGYVVVEGYDKGQAQAVAVRTTTVTNPYEWKKIREAKTLDNRRSR